jgi:acyl-homoserine lactone acylase PvdQ
MSRMYWPTRMSALPPNTYPLVPILPLPPSSGQCYNLTMPVDFNRRFFRSVTFIMLVSTAAWAALGLGAFYFYTHKSLPQTKGTARTAGLTAPGVIVRDKFGIPHCYAENQNDLFYLAGYAQAQDRLFQMDLLRRTAAGRMAEWKGEQALGQDRLARAIGFARLAKEQYQKLPPESRAVLDAFAEGINAYALSGAQSLPIEYEPLRAKFETWKPEDALTVLLLSQCAFVQEMLVGSTIYPQDIGKYRFTQLPVSPDPDDFSELMRNIPSFQQQTEYKPMYYQLRRSDLSLPSPHYLMTLSGSGIEVSGLAFPGFPIILSGISKYGTFSASPMLKSDAGDPVGPLVGFFQIGLTSYIEFWSITRFPLRPAGNDHPVVGGKNSIFDTLIRPFRDPILWNLASMLSPIIAAHVSDEAINRAWIQVKDWDGEMAIDLTAPLIYSETMRQAMIMKYQDEDGTSPTPVFLNSVQEKFWESLAHPDPQNFFDNPNTPTIETRNDFLLAAFRRAIANLESQYGPRMTQWKWGRAHVLKLRHPLGDEYLKGALKYFKLARPSPPMPGGRDTIWNGYYNWSGDYAMTAGTSLVLVMDLARPDELCVAYAGGQSGQPFSPHYVDLLQYWLAGECVPVALDRKSVEAGAESVLRLLPRSGKSVE